MKNYAAMGLAQELIEKIRPGCARVEIAGSLRRGKAEVKDIELVAILSQEPPEMPRAVFGRPAPKVHKTKLDEILAELCEGRNIWLEKDGERYKKIVLRSGICVDLFIVLPPAQWGVIFTIRTGPGVPENNFSQWVVTQRHKGGALPNGFRVQNGAVWEGEIQQPDKDLDGRLTMAMPEEMDFLNFLGLGWVEPGERKARWGQ